MGSSNPGSKENLNTYLGIEMKTFVTSDWHHSHANIIKYSKRPYANIDEMHEALIKNYNAVVGHEDMCYFLGDMSFSRNFSSIASFYSRLNGTKVLVFGNHDKDHRENFKNTEISPFTECLDYREGAMSLDGESVFVVMSHYPMLQWNHGHHGSLMLHGHCHSDNKMNEGTRRYDVGVDGNNYTPVDIQELWRKLKKNDSHKHH
jgi:calcineurin-like phosphoesterase family protein